MATKPLSDLTATWNASGTTFNAIKMNVTDTASAAGSMLLDLQVGGASQFRVSKGGAVSVGSTIELGHASDTTLARGSAGVLTVEGNTVYTSSNLPGTAITWAGAQTFTNDFEVQRAFAQVVIRDTGAAANTGTWRWATTPTLLLLQALSDDRLSAATPISFTRSGLTISAIDLAATAVTINSNTVYHAGNLPGTAITWTANQTLSNVDLVLATGAGTKIGTATNQKLGFFNATPVVQPTAVADATDAASVITQLNALLSRMRTLGLIAT